MNVETATVLVAGISVVIGVINSIVSSRRAEQQRNISLFMELYETYRTKERYQRFYQMLYRTNYEQEVGERYGPDTNIEMISEFAALFSYYEGIGFLVKNRWINLKHIEELGLSTSLSLLWEKYESVVREDREALQFPLWVNMEYLYDAMKQRQQATVST